MANVKIIIGYYPYGYWFPESPAGSWATTDEQVDGLFSHQNINNSLSRCDGSTRKASQVISGDTSHQVIFPVDDQYDNEIIQESDIRNHYSSLITFPQMISEWTPIYHIFSKSLREVFSGTTSISGTTSGNTTLLVLGITTNSSGSSFGNLTLNSYNMSLVNSSKTISEYSEMWYYLDPPSPYYISISGSTQKNLYCTISTYHINDNLYKSKFGTYFINGGFQRSSSVIGTSNNTGSILVEQMTCGSSDLPWSHNKSILYSYVDGTFSDNSQFEVLNGYAGPSTFLWNFNKFNTFTTILGVWETELR